MFQVKFGCFARPMFTDREAGLSDAEGYLEASPGIEPGCKDLQSSASPLRHEASQQTVAGGAAAG